MNEVYTQLIELLGASPDDPGFERVIDGVGEKPFVHDLNTLCFYKFTQSGFEIVTLRDERGTRVDSVIFFIDIPSVREGYISSYRGDFPDGVTAADSLKDVRNKMRLEPTDWFAETVPELRYDYCNHTLHFHFSEPGGEKMSLVGVHYQEHNRHHRGLSENIDESTRLE